MLFLIIYSGGVWHCSSWNPTLPHWFQASNGVRMAIYAVKRCQWQALPNALFSVVEQNQRCYLSCLSFRHNSISLYPPSPANIRQKVTIKRIPRTWYVSTYVASPMNCRNCVSNNSKTGSNPNRMPSHTDMGMTNNRSKRNPESGFIQCAISDAVAATSH